MDTTFVLKLGGSVFTTKDDSVWNFDYLDNLKGFLKTFVGEGNKVVLNVGGGNLSRIYQNISKEKNLKTVDIDWVGVSATIINAHFVRGYLGDELCNDEIVKLNDYESNDELVFEKGVIVGGGSTPGHSSDHNALSLSSRLNIKRVFVMKDVDGVYDSDPKANPEAKRLERISWDEYIEIIGNPKGFVPKSPYPVDIVAAKEAKDLGISFVILDGKNLENLKKALSKEEFVGTVIS